MQRLYGKSILIGKEPNNGSLIAVTDINGQMKGVALAPVAPGSVSRCKGGMAHCRIDIDATGKMRVTNLKAQNVTFVDGFEVNSKSINANTTLQLGMDRFPISVNTVLERVKKMMPAPPPPPKKPVYIGHLEGVWEHYHQGNLAIARRSKDLGLQSSVPMIFTMTGGVISSIVSLVPGVPTEIRALCYGITILGLIIMVYTFMKRKKDNSIDEKEQLTSYFQDHYTCPECGKFLGNQPYKLMKKQYGMQCPYCKVEFVEHH